MEGPIGTEGCGSTCGGTGDASGMLLLWVGGGNWMHDGRWFLVAVAVAWQHGIHLSAQAAVPLVTTAAVGAPDRLEP